MSSTKEKTFVVFTITWADEEKIVGMQLTERQKKSIDKFVSKVNKLNRGKKDLEIRTDPKLLSL